MIPHADSVLPELLAARRRAGRLLAGLDFDGTLAPIVPRPEDAALPAATREAVAALAARRDTDVAIISGRGLDDVARRVGVSGAYYAGNHGLEIEGPDVSRVHPDAESARPVLDAFVESIEAELAATPGAQLEDKGLTLSIHYRRVADVRAIARLLDALDRAAAPLDRLRITHGKRVVEIRPDVDWNKGHALRFLRETISAQHGDAPALFIGDDRTDEDAFREVGDDGFAILVADPAPEATAAHALLRSTGEAASFLRQLAQD